jgi:DDE family transposase
MIHTKDHNQLSFIDPWDHLGPKRRKLLNESWAGIFQNEILPTLPVREFSQYFCRNNGRSTKELSSVLGVILIQQTLDTTDAETLHQFAFNQQWHYALNIWEDSDDAAYMCEKTLWNMRNIFIDNDIASLLMDRTTKALAEAFDVDLKKQRIDSVHICSNMKNLGRIGLFSQTIHKFMVNLKRQHRSLFDHLPDDLVNRYLKKKVLSAFSMVKPSESKKTLEKLSKDLFNLVELYKNNNRIVQMQSYKLLARLLDEQCQIFRDEISGTETLQLKKPKEIPGDSLQNPSDPDASYDGHKGKGYQVQVMETYSENKSKQTLNLITHIEAEPAHRSDANALMPAIESTETRGMKPEEILGDSLYGSDENVIQAKEKGVNLISPVMPGSTKKEKLHLSDFVISDDSTVLFCPLGKRPVGRKTSKKAYLIYFSPQDCTCCPNRDKCPVKDGKKRFTLRYTGKDLRLAKRRQKEQSGSFISQYALRSGVEATMSEYDRLTGIKRLRVRGLKKVRFCAILKGIGINIRRAERVRKSQLNPPREGFPISACVNAYAYITETPAMLKHIIKHRVLRLLTISYTAFQPSMVEN